MSRLIAALLLAGLAATPVLAAPFKATLILREDDPRQERGRTERPALGQPGGTVSAGATRRGWSAST